MQCGVISCSSSSALLIGVWDCLPIFAKRDANPAAAATTFTDRPAIAPAWHASTSERTTRQLTKSFTVSRRRTTLKAHLNRRESFAGASAPRPAKPKGPRARRGRGLGPNVSKRRHPRSMTSMRNRCPRGLGVAIPSSSSEYDDDDQPDSPGTPDAMARRRRRFAKKNLSAGRRRRGRGSSAAAGSSVAAADDVSSGRYIGAIDERARRSRRGRVGTPPRGDTWLVRGRVAATPRRATTI